MFFVIFFNPYKEYNSCLISFLSFSELFPAFNWAREIGNLLSIWLGVSIFSSCPCCCILNSRMFWKNILFRLSFQFLFLVHSHLQFLLLNPVLTKPTWILFLSSLFFDFFNFSNNAPRSCARTCFLTNPFFMSLFLRSVNLSSFS